MSISDIFIASEQRKIIAIVNVKSVIVSDSVVSNRYPVDTINY